MDWAHKRRLMTWLVLGAVAIAFLLIFAFAVFYKTPTCTDRKQNADETGIDCGGSCGTLCNAEARPATVAFERVLMQSGRTDYLAYINNPNENAFAKDGRIRLDIYLQDGHVLTKYVALTLPAKSTTPLYIPSIANSTVQKVFASFDEGDPIWVKGSGLEAPAPRVSNISTQTLGNGQRVTAILTNQTAYVANNVPAIATVFGTDGTVIAASQTVIPVLPPQGVAEAIFTWNEPFSEAVSRVEIVPLSALPRFVP